MVPATRRTVPASRGIVPARTPLGDHVPGRGSRLEGVAVSHRLLGRRAPRSIDDARRLRRVVDEPVLVLILSFNERIAQRVDVITETRRELTPDGAYLGHDWIAVDVHDVIRSSGYAELALFQGCPATLFAPDARGCITLQRSMGRKEAKWHEPEYLRSFR